MKRAVFFSVLFLFLIFPISVFAGQIGDNLEYAGYLKTEVWVKNFNDEAHLSLSSLKNTFDIGLEYKHSDAWAFFFHPRYFYDAAYGIRNDFNSYFDKGQEKMSTTQRTEWLRDCYLDYTSDKLDIRLGKQQVVWGQADGLPFMDRVMPFDLTNYWLPDFADIRIPLWMVKAEYSPWLNSTLQFLLIPDFEASRSAPHETPFSFRANNDWETFKIVNQGMGGSAETLIYSPAKKLKNSRVGLRWRSIIETLKLDYSLNWLYGYSTSAYTYTESFTRLIPNTSFGDWIVSRKHKLTHLVGFTFNKSFVNPGPFNGWTLRGEFIYVHNQPTYYGTDGSRVKTELSDNYAYVLGFDKSFFTNWQFSTQFYQFITNDRTWDTYQVLNAYTYGVMDKVENGLTCKISTDFMHERLKPEILIIYADDNDGRISLKAKYELRDNFWLGCGYHHFWGPARGSNGQFRNNDHTFFDVTYTF
ncbi:MAG: hypothetical protein KKH11_02290 [Candidatus Omnitrophica bacterium]|nr:hypothetical protein [Candidatus Omnitrophota bacterium]